VPRRATRWAGGGSRGWPAIAGLAALAVIIRVPFLTAPLAPDEAGFLMVGSQWSPGRSLYGDYWVDRPPGLIATYDVVAALGGPLPLRLLGAGVAACSVLAAGWLGARSAPDERWAGTACAAVVLALVSSPLLDMTEVDGEILALPFLLVGVAVLAPLLVSGEHLESGAPGPPPPAIPALVHGLVAGAAGAIALTLKQNLLDVLGLGLLVVAVLAVRHQTRRCLALLTGLLIGAGLALGAVLWLAMSRGTELAGVWDAVVTFRLQAGSVIAEEAPTSTADRAQGVALAFLVTGAPLLLLLPRLRWYPRRPVLLMSREKVSAPDRCLQDPAPSWMCAALLLWEMLSVSLGGSYWLHYLVCLVPGLALVVATAFGEGAWTRGRWLLLAPVVASTIVVLALEGAHPPPRPVEDAAVIAYLRSHAAEGATAVVAFGDPTLLYGAGLSSPYPYLWSLPVRVRDPDLTLFTRLLQPLSRPDWIVVAGTSTSSWGIDGSRADRQLARNYKQVFRAADYRVWRSRP
jgi:hypothetical protein